jgi:hypothetical protein
MTQIIRQSLHQAITERNAKILYRGTGVESYNDPHTMGLVEVAPLLPDAGSQWTLRWREMDSNHWSRSEKRLTFSRPPRSTFGPFTFAGGYLSPNGPGV